MKKSPLYLYILGGLSLVSVLFRLKSVFLPNSAPTFQTTGNPTADEIAKASALVIKQTQAVQVNLVNKILALFLLGTLIIVFVFLMKKLVDKAGWTYLAYLGLTLFSTAYNYVITIPIFQSVGNETARKILLTGYYWGNAFNLLIFVIFLGITLFQLLRKPKSDLGDQRGLI